MSRTRHHAIVCRCMVVVSSYGTSSSTVCINTVHVLSFLGFMLLLLLLSLGWNVNSM